ncbi:hypothetical protein [Lentilactobacillus farraginis]|uniref:Uncharacterized protein n=1 Tax=Lentilactobacillus farraginis DSM 18382 = JCM 14108 TaxID=1423743 RepID=X0PI06_9LACO|nr:hypothetical protein [Lentilactobacillus farraginis]KRM11515.1 hypothetical protein FD41_GL001373 [Lentilactobacillus farraginis DSM 18382 = JCM 14108]GAF36126.1 hypothetical protein JCM14108_1074 [Lentilactobacillus farraginis DSM 18382 = JCM 14108]
MITLLLLAAVAVYYVFNRSTNDTAKNTDQFGRQREYARNRNDEPEILDKGQTNGRSRRHIN